MKMNPAVIGRQEENQEFERQLTPGTPLFPLKKTERNVSIP